MKIYIYILYNISKQTKNYIICQNDEEMAIVLKDEENIMEFGSRMDGGYLLSRDT